MNAAVAAGIENIAFTEVLEHAATTAEKPDGSWVGARLAVHEPVAGEFRLFMKPELLTSLVLLAYGPNQGIGAAQERDLLAEILNTVSGRFLAEILPPGQDFRLGLPETDAPLWEEWEKAVLVCRFIAEEKQFLMTISGLSLPDQAR